MPDCRNRWNEHCFSSNDWRGSVYDTPIYWIFVAAKFVNNSSHPSRSAVVTKAPRGMVTTLPSEQWKTTANSVLSNVSEMIRTRTMSKCFRHHNWRRMVFKLLLCGSPLWDWDSDWISSEKFPRSLTILRILLSITCQVIIPTVLPIQHFSNKSDAISR